jgi:hypothetical protein
MTEVNNHTLISKTDRTKKKQWIPGKENFQIYNYKYAGSKQRYIKNENWSDRKTWISEEKFCFSKRQNNCEELNTRFHAKFPAAGLKNPYCTRPLPCNTAHIIPNMEKCCMTSLLRVTCKLHFWPSSHRLTSMESKKQHWTRFVIIYFLSG